MPVLVPSLLGNTFVVKLHAGPRPMVRLFMRMGIIQATYIYRDPRAALLSAYEYGQRGGSGFRHIDTIEDAITFMLPYLDIWKDWLAIPQALPVRYEDLLANYDTEIARLCKHLSYSQNDAAISTVVENYRPGQSSSEDKGLHFHKGQPQRFRSVLDGNQLEAANQAFSAFIGIMGYAI
ncbi:MAG: sulfotransferase domain-containing protein [Chloroflexi bacterium]|nr:sulfotransferase domain-containing protein [Chloroflexota bacterium]